MASEKTGFANTRARMQRLKDARFFSGWVKSFDEGEVRIRLSSPGDSDPGDRFLIELYGEETVAMFQAGITMSFDNQAYLTILGPVQYRRTTENARLAISGVFGTVVAEGEEIEARVADISRTGIGLVVRKSLNRKSTVQFKLSTPAGEVTGDGEVRYCRPDTSGNGSFRAGIKLTELGRLEKARWMRLFEKPAA
jgi:hypothetical protein